MLQELRTRPAHGPAHGSSLLRQAQLCQLVCCNDSGYIWPVQSVSAAAQLTLSPVAVECGMPWPSHSHALPLTPLPHDLSWPACFSNLMKDGIFVVGAAGEDLLARGGGSMNQPRRLQHLLPGLGLPPPAQQAQRAAGPDPSICRGQACMPDKRLLHGAAAPAQLDPARPSLGASAAL